jgi:succinate-semialdehyde dehydrogenase/glutarate-semialdehyde dehydrogenase
MEIGIHLVSQTGTTGRFTTSNPATGEPVGSYPVVGPQEVDRAVARARQAQQWWGALAQPRRSALLRRVAQLLAEHRQSLAEAVVAEAGKPMQEALLSEVMVAADAALFCAENAAAVLRTEDIPHNNPALRLKRARLVWRPVGVVGIISPWNYPLSIPAADTFAALATGNAVVLKPSELTPSPVLELERIIALALVAEGLADAPSPLQIVTGLRQTGEALVAAAIDKLIFTGSVATGRKVAAAAAERLLPVVLELGGKDAMIVLDDCDLDAASSAAVWGSMMNAGQTCISVERCYVHRRVYSRFVAQCVEKILRLQVGPGSDPRSDMGPLINLHQLQAVARQVEEARALGATIQVGGCALPELGPNFYAPTLLTDVNPDCNLMREETFGPVLPVASFSSDDEAVELANRGDFALAASVWGASAHAARVATRIQAGTVMVNDVLTGFAVAAAPHGGPKLSGIGRSHGRLGMRELLNPTYIDQDLLPGMKKLWWFPYAGNFAAMSAFTEMLYAKGLRRRLAAALGALPAFWHKRR